MLNNYSKRNLLLLGAAMVATSAFAGGYVDVTNKYLKDATYIPGWQGVVNSVSFGVGEVWSSAFRAYQVISDLPAGDYTLTCNAFYRCGNNDYAKANMPNRPELYKAVLFAGDAQVKVKGLFDENLEPAPDNQEQADAAFQSGKYVNTLSFNHKGGDLVFGIVNTGCYFGEWCAFDNFKLVGPNGDVTIPNGDFSEGFDSKRSWDNYNADGNGAAKTPDTQKDGSTGGAYRKCGGSPYNYGQQVTLPAGKYRFGMLCFHRYGSEVWTDGTYHHHKTNEEKEAYGDASRTPKDWYDANDYDTYNDTHAGSPYKHAYIYMTYQTEKPLALVWNTTRGGKFDPATDKMTRVKDCWELNNGDLDKMPHNNPYKPGEVPYETENKAFCIDGNQPDGHHDSGYENEAGAAFVADPEKYFQYVEFELTEPKTVWVGMGKDANTGDGFWHAWADQKLLAYDENASGVDNVVVDENADAPVVYYNLQGVRVENPAKGLYIKVQGKKATKVIL